MAVVLVLNTNMDIYLTFGFLRTICDTSTCTKHKVQRWLVACVRGLFTTITYNITQCLVACCIASKYSVTVWFYICIVKNKYVHKEYEFYILTFFYLIPFKH